LIRSMTGYGAAAAETEVVKAAVTVRSVNHRFLDVSVHVSRRLQAMEGDIKRAVQERVARGRVDVAVQATLKAEADEVLLSASKPKIAALVDTLRQIQKDHALAGDVTVSDVARFPGALEILEPPQGIADEGRQEILSLVARALEGLEAMRRTEGAHLQSDLEAALAGVTGAASTIEKVSDEGRAARREALLEKVRSLREDAGLDEGRLYQEVVRLVDRHDVAEELQRLRSHVAQARDALVKGEPAGKRLDFLAQEMAREANTIGSKAATASVVQEVVALKSAIERLREQVQNVE
jgi:uncharacterized protein (TIGR00255 family)